MKTGPLLHKAKSTVLIAGDGRGIVMRPLAWAEGRTVELMQPTLPPAHASLP